ncbi:MAG: tetratricopeptide (TPR) repeat protein [Chlamydiales bacterium]|jgi:tetratricopeptide (TPR) repeat protein
MILATLLLILAPATQGRVTAGTDSGRFEVTISESPDGPLLTVHADNAPIGRVVRNVARQLKLQVEGLEDVATTETVQLYFEQRPFSEAIHWILGAAGLRGQLTSDTIRIFDDTPPFPTPEDLFDLAEVTWLRALRRSPSRPEGIRAEMALAEIQESRGALAAAVNHYEYLIERHPESEFTAEAMLLSGIHLGELGEWDAAARRFQQLTRISQPHPYHALARLELARALCYSNQPSNALYTVEALEQYYPTRSDQDKRARLVLRARAQALLGNAIDALRSLDLAAQYSVEDQPGIEVLEIRALALERASRSSEASVAWLQLAERTSGATQREALQSAARAALDSGDELGVLFIEAWASDLESDASIDAYAIEARLRIGLETDSIIHLNDTQRLSHAKQLLKTGHGAQAIRGLQLLYKQRDKLKEPFLLELGLTYANALNSESLTDMAIDILREVAPHLSQRDDRRRLYLLASTIYEAHGQLQEALDALEGRL